MERLDGGQQLLLPIFSYQMFLKMTSALQCYLEGRQLKKKEKKKETTFKFSVKKLMKKTTFQNYFQKIVIYYWNKEKLLAFQEQMKADVKSYNRDRKLLSSCTEWWVVSWLLPFEREGLMDMIQTSLGSATAHCMAAERANQKVVIKWKGTEIK